MKRQPTARGDAKIRGLGRCDTEEAFRKATLVAYALEGMFSTSRDQELFAVWEVAFSLQQMLAEAHGLPAPVVGEGGTR
jgi:hypothetical protein